MQSEPLFYSLLHEIQPIHFAPPETPQALGGLTVLGEIAAAPVLNGSEPEQPEKTGFTVTSKPHQTQNANGKNTTDTTADLESED
jgi:hypothetical protein